MNQDWGALERFLEASAATPAFKAEVRAWMQGRPVERLVVQGSLPMVKVARALAKLLEQYPDVPIERVSIQGRSG